MTLKEAEDILLKMELVSDNERLGEAIGVAVKAIELQTPKKVKVVSYAPAECPTCGREMSRSLGDGYYKHEYERTHCRCGQTLDWGR